MKAEEAVQDALSEFGPHTCDHCRRHSCMLQICLVPAGVRTSTLKCKPCCVCPGSVKSRVSLLTSWDRRQHPCTCSRPCLQMEVQPEPLHLQRAHTDSHHFSCQRSWGEDIVEMQQCLKTLTFL